MIDCVTLQLLYDESVTTERETLEVAESHYNDYIFPTIQRVLDEYEDQTVCIEEIDIDLKQLLPEEIPYRLETMLREAIERNLSRPMLESGIVFSDEELQQNPTQKHQLSKRNIDYKQIPLFSHDYKETIDLSLDTQAVYARPFQKQQLLDFLFMEQLPWDVEPEKFDAAQWCNESILSFLDDVEFARSLYYICKDPSAFYRLFTCCSDELLMKVLNRWLADDELLPSTSNIKKVLQGQGNMLDIKRLLSRLNAQSSSVLRILLMAVVRDSQIANSEFKDTLIAYFDNIENDRKVMPSQTNELAHITGLTHAIDLSQPTGRNDYNPPENVVSQLTGESQPTELIQASGLMLTTEAIKIEEQQMELLQNEAYSSDILNEDYYISSKNEISSEIQRIICENLDINDDSFSIRYTTDVAGLVLIHPFLIHFFRRLQLLNEHDQFSHLYQRVHAVHLLRCLTSKLERHQSHLMNLEKIMCGLSPKFPISDKYEVSDEEKQEMHDMFESLKQYWKTVSNTSTEGIQKTFICRTGLITYEKPYWVLRVENSALDILMDDIPWELSMLMFPWSERSIWIEWQKDN